METIKISKPLEQSIALDRFIAEKVLGWHEDDDGWWHDPDGSGMFKVNTAWEMKRMLEDAKGFDDFVFMPATGASAFVVQEELVERGWWFIKAVQQGQATVIARHEQHGEYSAMAEWETEALVKVYAAIGGAVEQTS